MTSDHGAIGDGVSVIEGRSTTVGGMPVRRLLPRQPRRTVGAWCFLDHIGPVAHPDTLLSVGPHPHIGLQTVTYLFEGEVRHADSLGSDVSIVPGQLNLMSAGRGVAHAEEGSPAASATHGVQLWIAQPESSRFTEPSFDHHPELPTVGIGGMAATILAGEFAGVCSPASVATPIVGIDLSGEGGTEIALDPDFEYVLAPLSGQIEVEHAVVPIGSLADLGRRGRSIRVDLSGDARALLLGGEPFDEPILMWWNFVAAQPRGDRRRMAGVVDARAEVRLRGLAAQPDRERAPGLERSLGRNRAPGNDGGTTSASRGQGATRPTRCRIGRSNVLPGESVRPLTTSWQSCANQLRPRRSAHGSNLTTIIVAIEH